jgi:hypothetical protein
MARAAAALLLLALAGAAQARPLDRLRCASGVVPPVSGLTIQPVNGGLDLSWTAVPCASHYHAVVDRADIAVRRHPSPACLVAKRLLAA